MEKSVKITGIIAGTILLVAIMAFYSFQGVSGSTVNANGVASIKAIPDLVTVYFSIETNASTAEVAKDANTVISDKLITELVKLGFTRSEIQTTSYNIYPDYTWTDEGQKSNGYKVSHYLKIELKTEDISQLGEVIDAGIDSGALINYINFELSQAKQNEYKAEALKQATEDARIKAEAIASGLDKRVGKIVSITSNEFNYYPWRTYDSSGGGVAESNAMAKEAALSIQPSEQEVSASVSVEYKIV